MTQPLTHDEQQTLKEGAYGAIFLVANADPGALDMVRESFAASKVLVRSYGVVREALTSGGLPELPRSKADLEPRVLSALRRSMAILKAKTPAEADTYRAWVIEACHQAAAAADGVKDNESVELSKISSALAGSTEEE